MEQSQCLERWNQCNTKHETLAVACKSGEERLDAIEEWRKQQNDKLGKLAASIDASSRTMNARLDGLKTWVIGLLGGVVASLILLIVNLATQHTP